jgi:hypothetical protein
LVYPIVLGSGERLFAGVEKPLRLIGSRTVGDSLAALTYGGVARRP